MNELQLVYDLAIRASDVLVCIGALVFLGLVWMDDGLQKEYKMSTEQQWKMLECAAKACGYEILDWYGERYTAHDGEKLIAFNPLTNPADTAVMCAKLDIGTEFHSALGFVVCRKSIELSSVNFYKDHDNSRLKAWMYAATMCAAKTQGYEE